MLKGICIDQGQTTVLEKGKSYFLFPHGPKHFLVSKFPRQETHKGCFRIEHFQVSEHDDWPNEPARKVIALNPDKVYKAKLIWRKKGYQCAQIGWYFIKPYKDHGYFYDDAELKKCGGCFPLHWFDNFSEVSANKSELKIESVHESVAPEQDLVVSDVKLAKYVQLSLFDF